MNHGGGSIMILGCFSAGAPGRLVKVEGEKNAAKYGKILEDNVMQSHREPHLEKRFVSSKTTPIHTAEVTLKWFKDNKVNTINLVPKSEP